MRKYIVRKIRHAPNPTPGRPHIVYASSPDDAVEKIKGHSVQGGMVNRGKYWEGFHAFDITHMTDTVIQVIEVKNIK